MTARLRARPRPAREVIAAAVGHLHRLADDVALFEHAEGAVARPEHGHCVDDNARAVVVLTDLTPLRPVDRRLLDRCLRFVLAAQAPDGRFHNRADHPTHRWVDAPGTGDWWGRALWALGVVVATLPDHPLAGRAQAAFTAGARHRSHHPRAMAYAALGAACIIDRATALDDAAVASALLGDAVTVIGGPRRHAWMWPTGRLTYANARLPEALIAAGHALCDHDTRQRGMALLGWLADVERRDGVMSFTPVRGRGAGDVGPAFDQQPIEAWALASAAARAHRVTGADRWRELALRCRAWFDGDNDAHAPMQHEITGGGHDGLTVLGRNDNQGAESTLALIGTAQAVDGCCPMT